MARPKTDVNVTKSFLNANSYKVKEVIGLIMQRGELEENDIQSISLLLEVYADLKKASRIESTEVFFHKQGNIPKPDPAIHQNTALSPD